MNSGQEKTPAIHTHTQYLESFSLYLFFLNKHFYDTKFKISIELLLTTYFCGLHTGEELSKLCKINFTRSVLPKAKQKKRAKL